jgi:hypothetical protein
VNVQGGTPGPGASPADNGSFHRGLGAGPPTVVTVPASLVVPEGDPASFTFEVSPQSPVQYQWFRDGGALVEAGGVSGARSSTLSVAAVDLAHCGTYQCVAFTGCGGVRSPAVTLSIGTPCGTSDFNGDGDFGTDQDIEAFFACLAGSCCGTCFAGGSDFNGDGDFGTDQDIEAFFRVLSGAPC